MNISASFKSNYNHHDIVVKTDETARDIQILPGPTGFGLSVSGAELLLLSMATCFCNDFYREAARRSMTVEGMDVTCTGEFGEEGHPGDNFKYTVHVQSDEPAAEIEQLIQYTDRNAEIHNTLRKGVSVTLTS